MRRVRLEDHMPPPKRGETGKITMSESDFVEVIKATWQHGWLMAGGKDAFSEYWWERSDIRKHLIQAGYDA